MKKISQSELISRMKTLVDRNYDRFFSVLYQAQDGHTRWVNCRLGVKKHEKGVGAPYDFAAKGCMPVWDQQSEGYRSLKFDRILEAKIEHDHLEIDRHLNVTETAQK